VMAATLRAIPDDVLPEWRRGARPSRHGTVGREPVAGTHARSGALATAGWLGAGEQTCAGPASEPSTTPTATSTSAMTITGPDHGLDRRGRSCSLAGIASCQVRRVKIAKSDLRRGSRESR